MRKSGKPPPLQIVKKYKWKKPKIKRPRKPRPLKPGERMVCSRIERANIQKFTEALSQQPLLTLQNFIGYAFQLFNEDKICIDGTKFVLASELNCESK